jgi:hypothetical protein
VQDGMMLGGVEKDCRYTEGIYGFAEGMVVGFGAAAGENDLALGPPPRGRLWFGGLLPAPCVKIAPPHA